MCCPITFFRPGREGRAGKVNTCRRGCRDTNCKYTAILRRTRDSKSPVWTAHGCTPDNMASDGVRAALAPVSVYGSSGNSSSNAPASGHAMHLGQSTGKKSTRRLSVADAAAAAAGLASPAKKRRTQSMGGALSEAAAPAMELSPRSESSLCMPVYCSWLTCCAACRASPPEPGGCATIAPLAIADSKTIIRRSLGDPSSSQQHLRRSRQATSSTPAPLQQPSTLPKPLHQPQTQPPHPTKAMATTATTRMWQLLRPRTRHAV